MAAGPTLERASGLAVELLYEDVQDGEFRVVLRGGDEHPEGLVSRTPVTSRPTSAVFGGLQSRWDLDDDRAYHIDAVSDDREWSARIEKTLNQLY